jgi:hypothetical protein
VLELQRHTLSRVASAVSASHQRTTLRVKEQWARMPNLEALLAQWDTQVKPSTAILWTRVLFQLRPDLRNAVGRRMLTVWEREAAVVTRRAKPIVPLQIQQAVRTSDATIARTIQFLWTSACRHADLGRAEIQTVAPGIHQMKWAWQKSDIRARRFLCKFVLLPTLPEAWATYDQVYRTLKRTHPDLTVHSIRRGALTLLATLGYSHAEIGLLSLHTPQSDESLGVRRYIDPNISQPEARKQLEMSTKLWRAIATKPVPL